MFLLLLLHALPLPLFDEAAYGQLVRWDLLHFLSIAKHGYLYEHHWAFLPALPVLLRHAGLLPVTALITILSLDAFRVLYELSEIVLANKTLAWITTLLALLPSSPVTLFLVPYNEPFFTYLSYRGMLYSARSQYLKASVAFALASCFRSNGVFLAGFVLWGLLIQSKPRFISIVHATFLSALVFAPFVYHNYSGYASFCVDNPETPEWCNKAIPVIYAHVQSKYWNGGLFKYWTLQQLPNILIALPPLLLIYVFGFWHIKAVCTRSQSPFASVALTPHVLHALFTSSLLLFASHTQITLRLAASMPTLYWAAAWLWTHPSQNGQVSRGRSWGRAWVCWSAIWGSISIVLWAAFLPPA